MKASSIQVLWSKAIHVKYNNKCCLCDQIINLEAHHYILRRKKLLFNDHKNGFLLCKKCHQECHTKKGEERLKKFMGVEIYFYLIERENIILKDYLREKGISRNEFNDMQAKELKEIIKEK